MSTQITAVYNALISRIESVLDTSNQGYFRLGNPYKPEENNSRFIRKGYGVAIGAAQNTNRQVNCSLSIERTMQVVLTREYVALESDGAAKATTELELCEDLRSLANNFEQDSSLNGTVMYTRYIGDGGIEYVESGTDRFMMLRIDISVEYLELYT